MGVAVLVGEGEVRGGRQILVLRGLVSRGTAVLGSPILASAVLAPLTLLLPVLGLGVNGVFLAEPISNVLGGLACLITMYFVVYRPLGKLEG